MKNNPKNNPPQLSLWNNKQRLNQAQQQKIKGGTYPWIDKDRP